jgi:Flavin containing amine oxidoreductase
MQWMLLPLVWLVGFISVVKATKCGHTDVLIVGAGFSGLAAAKELKAHNVSFKVVESTNRVGGWMSSKQIPEFDNLWIEEGAAWILYFEGNPILEYAKSKGLRMTLNNFTDTKVFEYDGSHVVRYPWSNCTSSHKCVYELGTCLPCSHLYLLLLIDEEGHSAEYEQCS